MLSVEQFWHKCSHPPPPCPLPAPNSPASKTWRGRCNSVLVSLLYWVLQMAWFYDMVVTPLGQRKQLGSPSGQCSTNIFLYDDAMLDWVLRHWSGYWLPSYSEELPCIPTTCTISYVKWGIDEYNSPRKIKIMFGEKTKRMKDNAKEYSHLSWY